MTRNHSFEPRVGKAQLVFGICYGLITLIALVLALYVMIERGEKPYMQWFMAFLFGLLTLKSLYLHRRVKKLIAQGSRAEAELLSCEGVRGITIIRARVEVPGYGPIEFEQRLAGMRVADEIRRFLDEQQQHTLPCLIIGGQSRHPRAMLTVETEHGHLKPESIAL